MTPEERRTFVRDHRTAIFGYNRAQDGPAMSISGGDRIRTCVGRANGFTARLL